MSIFKKIYNLIDKKTESTWSFLGLCPVRDKSLDCVRDGQCPDCKARLFSSIKIPVLKDNYYLTILECINCGSKYDFTPISISRFKLKEE